MNDRTPRTAEIVNYALDLFRAGLYVARPVRVDSVDTDEGTVSVVPMLTDNYTNESDETKSYELPIIPSIPVLFPEGGDFVDTWPIQKGDQGWILFADRSLDQWQVKGNKLQPVDPLTEFRHSLPAKGLFLPGGRAVKEFKDDAVKWDPARRVIGSKDGPRIAFTSDKIHLGVDHKEDATDNVALASLVKTEIGKVHDKLNAHIDDYNNHIHQLTSAGCPVSHTGVTQPVVSPSVKAPDVNDVKSEKVLCK